MVQTLQHRHQQLDLVFYLGVDSASSILMFSILNSKNSSPNTIHRTSRDAYGCANPYNEVARVFQPEIEGSRGSTSQKPSSAATLFSATQRNMRRESARVRVEAKSVRFVWRRESADSCRKSAGS
ncbi:hypothetical protein ACSQ67_025825 [Phaseolus vulgaris]